MNKFICKTFGYVWVSVRNHPGFPGKTKIKEHHLVWWERTGQRVARGFVLHHRDHDKTNNAFDNLELMTRSEHIKEHNPNQFVDGEVKRRISEIAKARCTPEWRAAVRERVLAQHKAGNFGIRTWSSKTPKADKSVIRKVYGHE